MASGNGCPLSATPGNPIRGDFSSPSLTELPTKPAPTPCLRASRLRLTAVLRSAYYTCLRGRCVALALIAALLVCGLPNLLVFVREKKHKN